MKIRWVFLVLMACCARVEWVHAENLDTANAIVNAFEKKDAAALAQLIDTEVFSTAVMRGATLPPAMVKDLKRGIAAGAGKLATGLVRIMEPASAVAKLMRVVPRADKLYVLVRMDIVENETFEYIEFVIGKTQRIEDWSMLSRGGKASDFLRLFFSMLLDEDGLRQLYSINDQSGGGSIKAVQAMSAQMAKGDYAGAYASLSAMPDAYKKTRDWAMIRASLATLVGGRLYEEATEHLARKFGDDPIVRPMLIGYYAAKGDWDGAYHAVEAVEALFGEDGLLASQKAAILRAAGKFPEAIALGKRGILLEPDRKAQYWELIGTALMVKDAPLVLSTLSAYEKAFNMQFDPEKLAKLAPYKEIAKSPEFAVWAQVRSEKAE